MRENTILVSSHPPLPILHLVYILTCKVFISHLLYPGCDFFLFLFFPFLPCPTLTCVKNFPCVRLERLSVLSCHVRYFLDRTKCRTTRENMSGERGALTGGHSKIGHFYLCPSPSVTLEHTWITIGSSEI